ncbi:MAG TPA: hypothetical protein VKA15_06815, partial [Isosphaeraceae bacterium]|nr:hypothetical protein [Isosphaeraceae bacterium]
MGSLKDFIAEQAEKLRPEEPQAVRKRDEWVGAVDRLNQQVREWLTQADPDHKVLEVRERPYQLREEGIGTYEARGLSISVGRREVRVEPIARNIAGPLSATGVIHVNRAYGRVDLSDGLKKFMIFRVEKDPEVRWNIIEQDGFHMQTLDQATFEEAFKSLLE